MDEAKSALDGNAAKASSSPRGRRWRRPAGVHAGDGRRRSGAHGEMPTRRGRRAGRRADDDVIDADFKPTGS
jgi:hypothetical protein